MHASKISTDFKLVIACAGCVALFLTIAVVALVTSARLADTADSVDQAHRMLTELEVTVSDLTDAESDAQQYAVRRQSSLKEDYDQKLRRVRQSLERLRTLAEDDPARRESIHHLVLLVERRIRLLDGAVSVWEGRAVDVAEEDAASQSGPTVMQGMREVAGEVADDYDRLLKRSKSSASATAAAKRIILIATITGVLFVIISTLLIRRDLALRAKSEKALRAAERKIRDVFENAPIAIFESSSNGRFLSANATMAAMLGYDSPEELLHHLNELKSPLYVGSKTRKVLVEKLNSEGVIRNYESQMLRKDGGTVWVTGNGRMVKDQDGGTHYEAMLYDITERKHAQEQLANVKSQLEFVVDSATSVSIISTDIDGRIVLFNPGAEKMLGYSSVEAIGQDYSRLHDGIEITERQRQLGISSESVTPFHVFVERARSGEAETREWIYVHKDGHHLSVLLRVTGVRNKQNELIGFLMIATDITYRKRSDQDRALLEQRLRRENLELERGARRALEANRMKSEFLANMSHELRTPLNGIIGFAEMMHDGVTGPISDEHKEYLADILTSARHLLQLINDILDLAKVEAGRMEFQPDDVDLGVIVREVQSILKSLSSKKQLRIDVDLDPGIVEVHLDPVRLKQVLYNYLSNAIKFTPEGGRIVVRTRSEGEETFRIEVQDNGIGIDPEDLSRLFTEFQQLDSSVGKRYQGTGLGLALTKRIAEAQGGRVDVKSTVGEGSTFSVILPLIGKQIVVSDHEIADFSMGTSPQASAEGQMRDWKESEIPFVPAGDSE